MTGIKAKLADSKDRDFFANRNITYKLRPIAV